MTEVEVEVEKPIAVVVGLDAEQADSAVAGVGNDHRRMRLVGGRHSARRLELVRPRTSRTEPTLNGGRQPRGQECTTVKALYGFSPGPIIFQPCYLVRLFANPAFYI